jgi:hypothetical protein
MPIVVPFTMQLDEKMCMGKTIGLGGIRVLQIQQQNLVELRG